jgi:hypothetical protein
MATAPSRRPGSGPGSRATRALLALLLLPALTGLLLAVGAGSANAADGYKYWNYFHVQGSKFVFATTGASDFTPKDGAVEAYRYGLSSAADGLPPRTDPTTYTFDDLCAGTKPKDGEKRVGVLLDYGTAADASGGDQPPKPRGACAAVPTKANGQQVLGAVADVRTQKSLTCAIDGYPVKTCVVTVKNPPAAAKEQNVSFTMPKQAEKSSSSSKPASSGSGSGSDGGGGFPWALVVVVVLVVVLAAGGLALARRNRTT